MRAAHVVDEMREQFLVELHHLVDRPVGGVQLEHRELGIVRRIGAFVAEDAPDLVDPLEPADDQALEVQLGRDPQIERDIERVHVRAERARRGAARDVQERRASRTRGSLCRR